MSDHARLSPSNHRWVYCPGSVREEAAYPDVPGEAAVDGTGSHLLLEMCLKNNVAPSVYEGEIIGTNHNDNPSGWMVNKDRIDRVQIALGYIKRRYEELQDKYENPQIKVSSESRSNPGVLFGRDDWWGTVDITIETLDQDGSLLELEVVDFKDGRGWVSENKNPQLMAYLIGKLPVDHWYIDNGFPLGINDNVSFRTTIIQPKTHPPIRYYEPTAGEVREMALMLRNAAYATDDPNAPLVPGKHCKWCKHGRAGNCQAKFNEVRKMTTEITQIDSFKDKRLSESLNDIAHIVSQNIAELSDENLAKIEDVRPIINEFFDRVEDELTKRLESGVEVPGYTLAPGRSTQVWAVSEEEVVKALRARRLTKDEIYPPKLISPAQVLKISKLTNKQKEAIKEKLITVKAGKMKLKKVAHSNNIGSNVTDGFAEVINEPAQIEQNKISFL